MCNHVVTTCESFVAHREVLVVTICFTDIFSVVVGFICYHVVTHIISFKCECEPEFIPRHCSIIVHIEHCKKVLGREVIIVVIMVIVAFFIHPQVSCSLAVLLVSVFFVSFVGIWVVAGVSFPVVAVVIMTVVVIMSVMVIVVPMIAMATSAFFSYVLDIVTLGIFQVMLGFFKFVWTVCRECCESCHSGCVHVKC